MSVCIHTYTVSTVDGDTIYRRTHAGRHEGRRTARHADMRTRARARVSTFNWSLAFESNESRKFDAFDRMFISLAVCVSAWVGYAWVGCA